MNVCIVGYGMMGGWHSDALQGTEATLHTLVGRRADATKEFAERYGYLKWTTKLKDALADPAIDIVILANPSAQHAETAAASLNSDKHTLVEIPLAMDLAAGEALVKLAAHRNRTLGAVYPLRARAEMVALRHRVREGTETVRQVCGRFYINRLENVGATGYQRSWTDNLLWHHTSHLLDFGLWMLDAPVRKVTSFMPSLDHKTGIPMEVYLAVETEHDQSLICTGSYYGQERIFESFVITDRDSYRLETMTGTLTTSSGAQTVISEKENCVLLTRDFARAIRDGREPMVPGAAVIPSLKVLQLAQDNWDALHGAQSIPGRQM